MLNSVLYLLLCRLRSRKFFNVLSFSVVAICVSVIIVALSISNGFENALIDKIVIASPHVTIFDDYEDLSLPSDDNISKDIKIAQVQALSIASKSRKVQGVLLRGVDLKKIPDLFDDKKVIISGKYPGAGEVIIGNKLSEASDLKTGDSVKILTGPAVSKDFKVSGVFKVGLYDFDSTVIIATFDDVVELIAEPEEGLASQVETFRALWLKTPFEARNYALKLEKMNPALLVSNWQDDNKSLVGAISLEKKVIFIVLLLLVVASSVAISNSQFIQIISQQEQIAALVSIGFTPKKILLLYILEGFLIGVIGSILGLVLSLAIVFILGSYPLSLPMDIYQVDTVPVKFETFDLFITAVCAVIMVTLSSVVPAYYASKLDPVEILRRY